MLQETVGARLIGHPDIRTYSDSDTCLGTALVTELFDDKMMAVPPALYTFGCMLTGTVLARLWWRQAV